MDTIAKNVFVEDRFPGVTLGMISQLTRVGSDRCAARA